METFVLLPFFLLSRVPSDADTWRYGPEYTFMVDANITTLAGRSILDFSSYEVYSTLKCRPRDSDTLRCQFNAANITVYKEVPETHEEPEDSEFHTPFDIRFDRRGIQSLMIPRKIDPWYLNMMRGFVSQMNLGVKLLHKPDGGFKAEESSYLGQCESLVNVSRETQDTEVSGRQDYEIVPMTGFQKKRGEMLVIEKTKNLGNCVDKRIYVMSGNGKPSEMAACQLLSSRSRIEISDIGFDSYTENLFDFTKMGVTFSFHEKVSLNLVSVLPAKEDLKPLEEDPASVSLYANSEEDYLR